MEEITLSVSIDIGNSENAATRRLLVNRVRAAKRGLTKKQKLRAIEEKLQFGKYPNGFPYVIATYLMEQIDEYKQR